jgi:hypothetical protein
VLKKMRDHPKFNQWVSVDAEILFAGVVEDFGSPRSQHFSANLTDQAFAGLVKDLLAAIKPALQKLVAGANIDPLRSLAVYQAACPDIPPLLPGYWCASCITWKWFTRSVFCNK